MLKHRVIPCLLLRNGGLVKTRRFADPKYVGDPINAIRIFNDKEVDELIVVDIEASRRRREPDYELVRDLASECFMPLCYGGGITSLSQAQRLFGMGVEKVAIQTAALSDLRVVNEIAAAYGSQAVAISIDVKKNIMGRAKLYSSCSGKTLDEPWLDFLKRSVDAGAGEVLLNAVDRDGMMQGYDLELIRSASSAVEVPVIALGGAGSMDHLKQAVAAGAHAVAAGAFFVFQGPHRAVLISYPQYQDLVHLLS
jgi:imidazole glycerol-phosphate synthase subunit HisF